MLRPTTPLSVDSQLQGIGYIKQKVPNLEIVSIEWLKNYQSL